MARAAARRPGAHSLHRRTGETAPSARSTACRGPSPWRCRMRRALRIRDDVGFFQTVRNVLAKRTRGGGGRTKNWTTQSGGSSLGPWLPRGLWTSTRVRGSGSPTSHSRRRSFSLKCATCRNGISLSRCCASCLRGEIRGKRRRNVMLGRSFAEMLEQTVSKYRDRVIKAA